MDNSQNPWDNLSSKSLSRALTLAKNTGHIQHLQGSDYEEMVNVVKEKRPSLKLISLLKQTTEKQMEHNRVTLEIQKRMEEKETEDITHLTILESKTKQINELNAYLQNIVSAKGLLVKRLQQPFVGEYIKIEAAYHKFASELFPLVSVTLADLLTHMDTLNWTATAQLNHDQFDTVLSHLTTCLARMQAQFQSLYRMRGGMRERSEATQMLQNEMSHEVKS